ncbi:hypothetical protein HK097_001726 [Rhizophlyctis rosea]|uniref:Uncharacterized protein n=1 Tax=Rhizophlyctis rosea TaxID=64517 RepID=A0AAD5X830_9FUNG|nr:hypothetical protein HK097_001726 [Rhizophlyctis rosea]
MRASTLNPFRQLQQAEEQRAAQQRLAQSRNLNPPGALTSQPPAMQHIPVGKSSSQIESQQRANNQFANTTSLHHQVLVGGPGLQQALPDTSPIARPTNPRKLNPQHDGMPRPPATGTSQVQPFIAAPPSMKNEVPSMPDNNVDVLTKMQQDVVMLFARNPEQLKALNPEYRQVGRQQGLRLTAAVHAQQFGGANENREEAPDTANVDEFLGRIGYAGLNKTLGMNLSIGSGLRETTLRNGTKPALKKARLNLSHLMKVMQWNEQHSMKLCSLPVNLLPWASDFRYKYDIGDVKGGLEFLKKAGEFAELVEHRFVFLNDQNAHLNSSPDRTIDCSLLKLQADVLDAVGGEDHIIVARMGRRGHAGVGDFEDWITNLPTDIRKRLVLMNDDYWSVERRYGLVSFVTGPSMGEPALRSDAVAGSEGQAKKRQKGNEGQSVPRGEDEIPAINGPSARHQGSKRAAGQTPARRRVQTLSRTEAAGATPHSNERKPSNASGLNDDGRWTTQTGKGVKSSVSEEPESKETSADGGVTGRRCRSITPDADKEFWYAYTGMTEEDQEEYLWEQGRGRRKQWEEALDALADRSRGYKCHKSLNDFVEDDAEGFVDDDDEGFGEEEGDDLFEDDRSEDLDSNSERSDSDEPEIIGASETIPAAASPAPLSVANGRIWPSESSDESDTMVVIDCRPHGKPTKRVSHTLKDMRTNEIASSQWPAAARSAAALRACTDLGLDDTVASAVNGSNFACDFRSFEAAGASAWDTPPSAQRRLAPESTCTATGGKLRGRIPLGGMALNNPKANGPGATPESTGFEPRSQGLPFRIPPKPKMLKLDPPLFKSGVGIPPTSGLYVSQLPTANAATCTPAAAPPAPPKPLQTDLSETDGALEAASPQDDVDVPEPARLGSYLYRVFAQDNDDVPEQEPLVCHQEASEIDVLRKRVDMLEFRNHELLRRLSAIEGMLNGSGKGAGKRGVDEAEGEEENEEPASKHVRNH